MIGVVGTAAGLVLGLLAGLLAKPSRQSFSERCGTTMGCTTCGAVGSQQEARR